MRDPATQDCHRCLAQSLDDLRPLHQMCREGRLYDAERWIAAGKPLQLAPETILKGSRPKPALQIALESGQHSLASLLLKSGYRLDLERYAPLDLSLEVIRARDSNEVDADPRYVVARHSQSGDSLTRKVFVRQQAHPQMAQARVSG